MDKGRRRSDESGERSWREVLKLVGRGGVHGHRFGERNVGFFPEDYQLFSWDGAFSSEDDQVGWGKVELLS